MEISCTIFWKGCKTFLGDIDTNLLFSFSSFSKYGDLDFGDQRITIEDIHVTLGLTVFYIIIIRLINNILNPTPKLDPSIFKGQRFLAKMNHVLLYVAILSITISGILKKLFNGETLTILFREIQINENFDLADQFYEIHILSNYTLIGLIVLHITAVIIHKLFFGDNLLKRIL